MTFEISGKLFPTWPVLLVQLVNTTMLVLLLYIVCAAVFHALTRKNRK